MNRLGAGWLLVLGSAALVVLAVFALGRLSLPRELIAVLPALPYVSLALALFFGWLFNRSQVVFVTLTLLVLYGATELVDTTAQAVVLRDLVAFLVGINLALFAWLPERGLFNGRTLPRWLLLSAQAGVLVHGMTSGILPSSVLKPGLLPEVWLRGAMVSEGAVIVMVLGGVGLILRLIRGNGAAAGSLFGVWLAVAVALVEPNQALRAEVLFALMGLLLILGVVVESHRMAYRDELTGLPGRRALEDRMARLGRRYAIAMGDIDHFKVFNDTHGHEAGDQVLRHVARMLGRTGGGATAYRYGGEEFTLVFPRRTAEAAQQHLDRVREEIAAVPFKLRGDDRPSKKPFWGRKPVGNQKEVNVTISIGVADDGDGGNPKAVMEVADGTLYEAKKKGRNCVAVKR